MHSAARACQGRVERCGLHIRVAHRLNQSPAARAHKAFKEAALAGAFDYELIVRARHHHQGADGT